MNKTTKIDSKFIIMEARGGDWEQFSKSFSTYEEAETCLNCISWAEGYFYIMEMVGYRKIGE